MRNCFIPGCDQICKGVAKRMMFTAPKDLDLLDAWVAVLPKNRRFKANDKVCDRHFLEQDISTTYDNVVQGVVYKIERGRARLRLNAVPCRNLEPSRTSKNRHIHSTRKVTNIEPAALENMKNVANVKPKHIENHFETNDWQHLEVEEVHGAQEMTIDENLTAAVPADNSESVEEVERLESIEISEVHCTQEVFESLYDDIFEVILPNTLWGVHRCPERSSIFFSYVDPYMLRTTKMITINNQSQVKVVLGNRLLTEQSLVCDINSIEALSEAIAQIDEMKLCPRVYDHELCEVTVKEDSEMCTSCSQS